LGVGGFFGGGWGGGGWGGGGGGGYDSTAKKKISRLSRTYTALMEVFVMITFRLLRTVATAGAHRFFFSQTFSDALE